MHEENREVEMESFSGRIRPSFSVESIRSFSPKKKKKKNRLGIFQLSIFYKFYFLSRSIFFLFTNYKFLC